MSRSPYNWSAKSRRRLNTCDSRLVELLTAALHHPDCPFDVTIVEGHRSNERQAELYAQGRTAPGPKVTNAKPGQSKHNSFPSAAVDAAPCDRRGDPLWDDKDRFDAWGAHVKRVADEEGLPVRWGGDFSWYDGAHFELP